MPPPAAASTSFRTRVGAYRWLLSLAVGVFAIDQITKIWVLHTLPLNTYHPFGSITIIPGFFHLVHVSNTGAAWSLFSDKSGWLAALAVVTLTAIFYFRRHLELNRPTVQVSFGLLCGGIVGNLVDRLYHGHVIDFLLFEFGTWEFPVFNAADTAICVGVGLYLIHSFRAPQPDTTPQAPEQQPPSAS